MIINKQDTFTAAAQTGVVSEIKSGPLYVHGAFGLQVKEYGSSNVTSSNSQPYGLMTRASGYVEITGTVIANSDTFTVTIDSNPVVVTAASMTGVFADDVDTIVTQIATAINTDPTVSLLVEATAVPASDRVNIQAIVRGEAGNSVTFTASDTAALADMAASGAGTLAGAVDTVDLTITVDGSSKVIDFSTDGTIADRAAATAAEVVATINAAAGVTVASVSSNKVRLSSTDHLVEVTVGNTVIGLVTSTAATWTVVLEGSLDGVTYTTILSHSNSDGTAVKWTAANLYPVRYFRSRCSALTLNGGTSVVASIVGI